MNLLIIGVQKNDFPNIENLLELTINGEQWLALERHDEFKEPFKFGQKATYDTRMWLQIRSYLVRESQYSQAKKWLSQQKFMGGWMPEGYEYYNGNIINYFNRNTDSEWREVYPKYDRDNRLQFKVIPSVENHIWESDYGNDSLKLYAPTPMIFHWIEMFNTVKQGYWVDKQNHLICFNPKIDEKFKNMLLIKKEPFLNFLKEKKLKLIWTTLGEKHAYKQSKFLQEISGVYYLYGKNALVQGNVQSFIQEIDHYSSEE